MGGPYVDTNAMASAVDTQVDLLPDDWLQFTGVEDSEHYSLKNIIKGSNIDLQWVLNRKTSRDPFFSRMPSTSTSMMMMTTYANSVGLAIGYAKQNQLYKLVN